MVRLYPLRYKSIINFFYIKMGYCAILLSDKVHGEGILRLSGVSRIFELEIYRFFAGGSFICVLDISGTESGWI